jgi:hypothetical protein
MFKPNAFDDHLARHGRGVRWLALGAGLGAAVLFVAVTAPQPAAQRAAPTRTLLDTAPADAWSSPVRVAALDAGVDWSRVESAGDVAAVSIAAYEP